MQIAYLEMLVFEERGKPEYTYRRRKTSRTKEENQRQTQPTYDAGSGNRTRDTLVGGERSHHCAIPATRKTVVQNGATIATSADCRTTGSPDVLLVKLIAKALCTTASHGTKLHILVSKLRSGTSKTKAGALFWKSHCATCSPVALYRKPRNIWFS